MGGVGVCTATWAVADGACDRCCQANQLRAVSRSRLAASDIQWIDRSGEVRDRGDERKHDGPLLVGPPGQQ